MGRKVEKQFKFETDTDTLRYEVGQRIKRLRELKNESQEAFSEHIGIAKGTYQKLENGYSELKTEYLYKVAKYCKCNISFLLGETDIDGYHTFTNKRICDEMGISEETTEALINADKGQIHFIEEVIKSCLIDKDGFYYSLMANRIENRKHEAQAQNEWFPVIDGIKEEIEKEHPDMKPSKDISKAYIYDFTYGDMLPMIRRKLEQRLVNEGKYKTTLEAGLKEVNKIEEETNHFFIEYYIHKVFSKLRTIDLQNDLAIYLNGGK